MNINEIFEEEIKSIKERVSSGLSFAELAYELEMNFNTEGTFRNDSVKIDEDKKEVKLIYYFTYESTNVSSQQYNVTIIVSYNNLFDLLSNKKTINRVISINVESIDSIFDV